MKLTLRKTSKQDYKFLYRLLKQRNPDENISHKVMPTYKQHCEFNDKQPYPQDYIVFDCGKKIGRFYVTDRMEVGIKFIDNKYTIPMLDEIFIVKDITGVRLFFNVSPRNKLINDYLKKKGLKIIQYTYESIS